MAWSTEAIRCTCTHVVHHVYIRQRRCSCSTDWLHMVQDPPSYQCMQMAIQRTGWGKMHGQLHVAGELDLSNGLPRGDVFRLRRTVHQCSCIRVAGAEALRLSRRRTGRRRCDPTLDDRGCCTATGAPLTCGQDASALSSGMSPRRPAGTGASGRSPPTQHNKITLR